ncbi:hypothetical protein ACTWP5_17620 [Streptomyces sp. 4N509B]|uniref:hypothetical protein n=1 Tax=Streptomyces sp. 4N509B TaxID=3457413 RepID=UPI003FCFA2C6
MPTSPFAPSPDYRLVGYEPADRATASHLDELQLSDDSFTPLAWHHERDGSASFWIFHDGAAIWDVPGTGQLVALCVARDPGSRRCYVERSRASLMPLAQRWLISRGAPPQALAVRHPEQLRRPADSHTVWLERQLRDSHHRYRIEHEYTHEPASAAEGYVVEVVLRDRDIHHAHQPYRLIVEQTRPDGASYTLRQGAFPDHDAAMTWLARWHTDRTLPLPKPTVMGTHHAAIAALTTPSDPAHVEPHRPGHRPSRP